MHRQEHLCLLAYPLCPADALEEAPGSEGTGAQAWLLFLLPTTLSSS